MIEIAQQQDSKAILNVIKQSIESCSLDHDNNQNVIDEWLSNKTEENIINWINNSYSYMYKKDNKIVGFILMSKGGVILLNYVLPDYQGDGIGSAMVDFIISLSSSYQIDKIKLESTLTARKFYESKEFVILEETYEHEKLIGFKMERRLSENSI
ncbi:MULTISPECIES: GNAT family N-acetyltransferase [Acinetobacter]|uniref:GNAT family N-acetyltransferase n=2 Tax=Acinetobacter haemolyticus TaxID=29430 RepID=A0A514TDT7_ACIHA|nr:MULTISPECIES: GNAT family N-acetyltransferase [Acinetobacter]EEH69446.1 acetyltransferase, GNAT family [Acinetobacter sp. ATCC 27244]MQZ32611.1 GNAT family N-acetyltransferase [Acinetobacter haemolyticus]NAR60951.1 GNAT family N-acetyltransferase [Acinetobacter haemolyticus]NAR66655.1 GNAT family N-acetyltransferase [Acinetobacter haemolyticus]NAR70776.1 GNAT family N-acetyltransferase [Acinetobacter haemolyticus]